MSDEIADKCENCKHWEKDPKLAATTGKCKESPPQMVIYQSQHSPATHTTNYRSRAEWPVMAGNKVCGRHIRKLVLHS
jgi:hypothetical protein